MKEDKIEVTVDGRLFELFPNMELLVPGGKIFNVYSQIEFVDCILCWENEHTKEVDECHFVGNYEPDKRLLEKLADSIKKRYNSL